MGFFVHYFYTKVNIESFWYMHECTINKWVEKLSVYYVSFYLKLRVTNSHARGIFLLDIYMSVNNQYVFEKGSFLLSGGTSCLFTKLIWQVIEEGMLFTVLGFSGDRESHRSVLALKISGFPKGCCHHDLKTFFETGYNSLLLENVK